MIVENVNAFDNLCPGVYKLGECLDLLTKQRKWFGRIWTFYSPVKRMLHFGHIQDAQFFYRLMPLIHYPVDLLMVHQTERSLQSEPSNIFADFSIAIL